MSLEFYFRQNHPYFEIEPELPLKNLSQFYVFRPTPKTREILTKISSHSNDPEKNPHQTAPKVAVIFYYILDFIRGTVAQNDTEIPSSS